MTETAPKISVIVASIVGGRFLDDCLDSIHEQSVRHDAEVVVVSCGPEAETERIKHRHPDVKVIHRAERESVPALRRVGLAAAAGSIIAIIEEHCVAEPGWLDAVSAAMKNGAVVAGGAVAPDNYATRVDWVVYFCEYNISLPPAPRGPVAFLNGANIAYERAALDAHEDVLGDGYWEAVLHPALMASGTQLESVPEMGVRHRGPFSFQYYLRQRYWFSRAFAGARKASALNRAAYLIAAPLVPFVLLARMGSRVASKGLHTTEFLKTVPLIFPALVVYVAGEWVGYLAGPGDALSHVE